MTINVYSLGEPVKRCIERSERFDISHSPFLAQHIGFLGFRLPSGSLGGSMGRKHGSKNDEGRQRQRQQSYCCFNAQYVEYFDESNGAI